MDTGSRTSVVIAFGIALLSPCPLNDVMYCDRMASLGELAAKMRDKGLSESQTIGEFRKMSPVKTVNSDVSDLVSAVYMEVGRTMSPSQFRAFFQSYCRRNGFDRPL